GTTTVVCGALGGVFTVTSAGRSTVQPPRKPSPMTAARLIGPNTQRERTDSLFRMYSPLDSDSAFDRYPMTSQRQREFRAALVTRVTKAGCAMQSLDRTKSTHERIATPLSRFSN